MSGEMNKMNEFRFMIADTHSIIIYHSTFSIHRICYTFDHIKFLIMKKSLLILCLISLLFSCTNSGKKDVNGKNVSPRVKKEVLALATNYINGKFKEPKKTISKDGIITIGEDQSSYVIDPAKIYTGLIDDDNTEDAIISMDYYHGQYILMSEHLILINTDGKLMLSRAIESDMKILGIKDRVITAEIYTKSRNSPLANCSLCKEVVKYRFKSGDLIKVE
jgi:hypothetical protein